MGAGGWGTRPAAVAAAKAVEEEREGSYATPINKGLQKQSQQAEEARSTALVFLAVQEKGLKLLGLCDEGASNLSNGSHQECRTSLGTAWLKARIICTDISRPSDFGTCAWLWTTMCMLVGDLHCVYWPVYNSSVISLACAS